MHTLCYPIFDIMLGRSNAGSVSKSVKWGRSRGSKCVLWMRFPMSTLLSLLSLEFPVLLQGPSHRHGDVGTYLSLVLLPVVRMILAPRTSLPGCVVLLGPSRFLLRSSLCISLQTFCLPLTFGSRLGSNSNLARVTATKVQHSHRSIWGVCKCQCVVQWMSTCKWFSLALKANLSSWLRRWWKPTREVVATDEVISWIGSINPSIDSLCTGFLSWESTVTHISRCTCNMCFDISRCVSDQWTSLEGAFKMCFDVCFKDTFWCHHMSSHMWQHE